jgi:hypothetical protein
VLGRLTLAALVCAAGVAHADDDDASSDNQVVVINAAAKLGDIGQIARIRQVLEKRGLLVKLPEPLQATLDGSTMLIGDSDAIRDAYANSDYELALKIIEADEQRVLGEAVSGDPIPALAELSQWRGIIAAALNEQDEAVRWFRAAHRFNPAWQIDKKLASPRVRAMVKRSKHEPDETGIVRVDADPDDAKVSIDGGEARAATDKLELPIGVHLVTVSAHGRKPYAELVDVQQDEPYKIQISLDKESTLDRAARLVDETVASPTGKSRLQHAKALARLTGAKRMLFIEDGNDDHVTVRLYDIELKKVSRPLELEGQASSAAIARKIKAALDPDNLLDANTVVFTTSGAPEKPHWYSHWYVWAGAALVVGASVGTYEYMSREPTAVRF